MKYKADGHFLRIKRKKLPLNRSHAPMTYAYDGVSSVVVVVEEACGPASLFVKSAVSLELKSLRNDKLLEFLELLILAELLGVIEPLLGLLTLPEELMPLILPGGSTTALDWTSSFAPVKLESSFAVICLAICEINESFSFHKPSFFALIKLAS